MGKTIITATPPTPNGDLHVGHVSGPYLGADVYCRYLKARGRDAIYVSSADDNQSYVVTTAINQGKDPRWLAAYFADRIRETLAKASISVDAFTSPDARHTELVQSFFRRLYQEGKFKRKRKTVLYCEDRDHYAFESYLAGTCPHCIAPTAGAICETCGHPNDAATILDPVSSLDPAYRLLPREVDVMVFELEAWREPLRRFYADKWRDWRPHLLRLVEELLEGPLPDYPVTYISDWGIAAPFPGFEGHVLNVWAEMLPGLMRTAEYVEDSAGRADADGESLWHPDSGNRIVQFIGYDNSFFFAVVHVALALASDGRVMPPYAILTNEFYELDNFKFSTSKNNVIWARDLLDRRTVDETRFFLALSNPENQTANFTEQTMDRLVAARLTGPWQRLSSALAELAAGSGPAAGRTLPVGAETRALVAKLVRTFERYYEIETFSMQRSAETLSQLIGWLARRAQSLADEVGRGVKPSLERVATPFAFLSVLPGLAHPLLPDFSARLDRALGGSGAPAWPDPSALQSVRPFAPPRDLLPRNSGPRGAQAANARASGMAER